jgi:hypothetical protein
MAAILDTGRVSKLEKRGDEIKKKSSMKFLSQSQPNFAEMILRRSPFKIVSDSTALYPRWPPLLNIEIWGPPKDHFSKVWLRLPQEFHRRIFFLIFIPLFSNFLIRSK